MAWRIDKQVVKGELDFRVQGKVTGRIWLAGWEEPLRLDLEGNPWRDLAGTFLRFSHANPEEKDLSGLAPHQIGSVGDITASRKVKIPEVDVETMMRLSKAGKEWPWHLGNAFYLEWYGDYNGRVVIESTDYELEVDGAPTWTMTPEEEEKQRIRNSSAIQNFLGRLTSAFARHRSAEEVSPEDEAPTSRIEAEADEEAARMDLLLDRVDARMSREDAKAEDLDRIMEEERQRLRRERGEPEPEPLTPEQERERDEWVREMNEACRQAEEEWNSGAMEIEERSHPLQEACSELGSRLFHRVRDEGWIPDTATREHPLQEICDGVSFAGAKLAGALHQGPDESWPPEPLFAGDTLVRLKKARTFLRDALAGLDSADEERLATPEWRSQTRIDIEHILTQVQTLIDEVRSTLE